MATLKTFLGIAKASIKRSHIKLASNLKKLITLDMGGSPFTPSQVSNMVVWYDANQQAGLSDGGLVTSMTDFSGNGRHALGSDASRPTYETNELNGKPVYRFSGSQGRQLDASPDPDESAFDLATYSIFFVAKRTSGSGATVISKNTTATGGGGRRKIQITINGSVLALSAGSDGSTVNQAMTTTNWNVCGVIGRANNNHDLIINGVVNNKTTTLDDSTFNDARVEIAQAFSNGAERLNGDIAEILVYSGDVGSANRAALIQYLGNKWGITVS